MLRWIRLIFFIAIPSLALGQVQFSHESGFYNKPIAVEVSSSHPTDSIYIRYGGGIPTTKDILYTQPLAIDGKQPEISLSYIPTNPSSTVEGYRWTPPSETPFQGTIVTAACINNGITHSVTRRSYFISPTQQYSLPIVSLIVDSIDFFGYQEGIYVPGIHFDNNPDGWQTGNYFETGDSWIKNVHISFFDEKQSLQLTQNCKVSTHGSASKILPAKSLRLYAKASVGDSLFRHAFFADKEQETFKRLILRNSGQDFTRTLFADAFIQSLITETGLEYQSASPSIVFINGEYWGIHNLRERYDRFYLSQYHNEPVDSVDLIEISMSVKANEGDTLSYHALMDFVANNDLDITT